MIEIADRKGRTNINTWGNETRGKKERLEPMLNAKTFLTWTVPNT